MTTDLLPAASGQATPDTVTDTGAFYVWPADAKGEPINPPDKSQKPADYRPNPGDDRAVEIYFGLLDSVASPAKEQVELQVEIEKVLRVVQRVFLSAGKQGAAKFRIYYTRLFYVAQVGLQGAHAAPEVARAALAQIGSDLLEDEAGRVKNAHLRTLGIYAGLYSLPFLLAYVLLCLPSPGGGVEHYLQRLQIDRVWLGCFALLWAGCFHGVWLSYGIRKNKFVLADLVTADDDLLVPQIRLLFAGLLTCAVGLTIALGIVDVKLGTLSLADFTHVPALAYVAGLFFGIGELALPASIGSRASTLAGTVK